MEALYETTTFECSKLITNYYSTSFSLGIKTLDKRYHKPIYAIYGFVRYADEIVDTFHTHNKLQLLDRFEADTYTAIEEQISLNPVLHSFQKVVRDYKIEHDLIDAFLRSMRMDLYKNTYDAGGYDQYIYGSAEVVGLMCLRVFCEGDTQMYDRLKESARKLGAAFQKVNFLRDMQSDFADRGRIYFPGVNYERFTPEVKEAIEADIAQDFVEAAEGIKQLPDGARSGVYLAYIYYKALFNKIRQAPAQEIQTRRIRVPDTQKAFLWLMTYFRSRMSLI